MLPLKAYLKAREFQGLAKAICPPRLRLHVQPQSNPDNFINTVTPRWHVPTLGPGEATDVIVLTSNHNPQSVLQTQRVPENHVTKVL